MKVKINGRELTEKTVNIQVEEASDSMAVIVIIAGVLACIRWWFLWA